MIRLLFVLIAFAFGVGACSLGDGNRNRRYKPSVSYFGFEQPYISICQSAERGEPSGIKSLLNTVSDFDGELGFVNAVNMYAIKLKFPKEFQRQLRLLDSDTARSVESNILGAEKSIRQMNSV